MGNETPTNDAPVTVEEALRWYAENTAGCRKIGRDGDVFRQALDADGGKRALAALASAPAPSWSETPEHIRDHLALLAEVEFHLTSTRVFITTREKMHPCGVELHDELLGKVTAAIETIGKGQVHG